MGWTRQDHAVQALRDAGIKISLSGYRRYEQGKKSPDLSKAMQILQVFEYDTRSISNGLLTLPVYVFEEGRLHSTEETLQLPRAIASKPWADETLLVLVQVRQKHLVVVELVDDEGITEQELDERFRFDNATWNYAACCDGQWVKVVATWSLSGTLSLQVEGKEACGELRLFGRGTRVIESSF